MRIKLMSREEIRKELGWTNIMIQTLLGAPDSNSVRRIAGTGQYTRGLYERDRVFLAAETPEARLEEKRWADTVHGHSPAPGWTTRSGDIGDELGIAGRAVGKILGLIEFRVNGQVTDAAVAAGCGVRRWDGDRFHIGLAP